MRKVSLERPVLKFILPKVENEAFYSQIHRVQYRLKSRLFVSCRWRFGRLMHDPCLMKMERGPPWVMWPQTTMAQRHFHTCSVKPLALFSLSLSLFFWTSSGQARNLMLKGKYQIEESGKNANLLPKLQVLICSKFNKFGILMHLRNSQHNQDSEHMIAPPQNFLMPLCNPLLPLILTPLFYPQTITTLTTITGD